VATLEIMLGFATLRAASVVDGVKLMLHGVAADPSVLWFNARVRRFFGSNSGFLSYSPLTSQNDA
jgi:hypothetical protein